MFGQITRQAFRKFTTSAVRRSHPGDGEPGKNLPFGVENRYLLTGGFILFFGSAFSIPFFVIRFQMLKA